MFNVTMEKLFIDMKLETFGFLTAISIIASTLSILLFIVYFAIRSNKNKTGRLQFIFVNIYICFCTFLFIFSILFNSSKIPFICFASYVGFTFLIKEIILLFNKSSIKFRCFKIYSILYSPDYCFTDLQKESLNNDCKNERAKIIKINNVINIFVSSIFFLVAISIKISTNDLMTLCIFNTILKIRLVSRSFEIIISFCKDVYDKKKQSTLKNKERILLAIISLIELTILSGSLVFCYKNMDYTFSKSLDAIIFGNASFGLVSSISALAGFSLIGIVITQYLSKSNDSK